MGKANTMNFRNFWILMFFLGFGIHLGYAQKITDGTWYNEEKTGRVQFYENQGKLFGKVVWLKEPIKDGKVRTDLNNPNKELRSRPIMGAVFLKNFKKINDREWEGGTIYDPNNGKTYSCIIKVESSNKISVRGYIGISLIGRTSIFTRATN